MPFSKKRCFIIKGLQRSDGNASHTIFTIFVQMTLRESKRALPPSLTDLSDPLLLELRRKYSITG